MKKFPEKKNFLENDRGMALLLTILIIALMSVITSEFIQSRWHDRYAAANLSDGIQLHSIAKSGIQFAVAVLLEEKKKNDFDTLHEVWNFSPEWSVYSKGYFNDSHFEIDIQDQSGKIQINRLIREDGQYDETQRDLLVALLSQEEFDLTAEAIDDIIDNIKDWIDPDDEETQFGSENAYYQTLEKPYFCRNAPLESLDELLLVNHMTPKLYHGTDETPGLKHFLTVYGEDGRININTAATPVLKALSLVILDQDLSEEWIKYREDEDNDLSQYDFYPGLSDLSGSQGSAARKLLTISSHIFRITSEGVSDNMRKGISSVIDRDSETGGYQTLSWKVL